MIIQQLLQITFIFTGKRATLFFIIPYNNLITILQCIKLFLIYYFIIIKNLHILGRLVYVRYGLGQITDTNL